MSGPNYGLLRPMQAPSIMESRKNAATLSSLVTNQERAGKQMAREDEEAKMTAHLRKASMFGNALEGISGLSEEERAAAYPKIKQELVSSGVMGPQDLPDEYDPGLYRQNLMRYRSSKEGIDSRLKNAQIAKLEADAKRGPGADPLSRQLAVMDARDQMQQKQKQREIEQYSQVGGWRLAEGATPTMDDAKKFKSGASAARTLLENLNEYQGLVDKYGSEVGGKVAQRMDSLARDIQLSAKNEDLYGLGVLTGPDLALLEEIIQAPTGIGAKLDPFSGGRAANKAQQFREMLNTRIGAKAKTYGFEPQEEWQRLAQGGPRQKNNGFGPGAMAAETPKQGAVEEGYVFMGGDPADPKSWKRAK
jgi:hypothetical protein